MSLSAMNTFILLKLSISSLKEWATRQPNLVQVPSAIGMGKAA